MTAALGENVRPAMDIQPVDSEANGRRPRHVDQKGADLDNLGEGDSRTIVPEPNICLEVF